MGTEICCEAQVHEGPDYGAMPKESEFEETNWPEND